MVLTFSPGVWPVTLAEAPSGHHLDVLEAARRSLLLGAGDSTLGSCGHHAEAGRRRHRHSQMYGDIHSWRQGGRRVLGKKSTDIKLNRVI